MSAFDVIDAFDCRKCSGGGFLYRVTGGSLDGAHVSSYACDECVGIVREAIAAEVGSAEVVELPGKMHQPSLLDAS